MMKRVAVGVVSAVAGGSLLLSAGAASAQHVELRVKVANVDPNPVVVKQGQDTRVTVEVRTTRATRVELRLKPVSNQFGTQSTQDAKLVHQGDLWRFVAEFDDSDAEGRWLAIADAYDRHGKKVTDQVNFSVKKQSQAETRLTAFTANPKVVSKGRWLKFSGRLQVSESTRWKGLKDQEVGIYFRSQGSSAWKYVTSAETERDGRFYAKGRASKSGEYRAVFDGDDKLADSKSQSKRVRVWRW